MNTLAIIQARTGSTRFPGKMLADLCGKPVVQHVYERVSDVVTQTVIAVPHGDGKRFASLGLRVWEAPEGIADSDVLGRCVACIDDLAPSTSCVVRVCGDNPLLDVDALSVLVYAFHEFGPDYAGYRLRDNRPAITVSTGYFAEAAWPGALRSLNITLPPNHHCREHVTAALYEEDGHKVDWLPVPEWYYSHKTLKLTAIDTPDDLERIRNHVKAGRARS